MAYRKYRNVKCEMDGIMFDSKGERDRYAQLKLLELAGEIYELEVHPLFLLQEAFTFQGHRIRKIEYEADFSYYDANDNAFVIEDAKGVETKDFRLKWKMMKYMFRDKNEGQVRLVLTYIGKKRRR